MPLALIYQALLAILFIATGIFSPASAVAQALLPVPALTARVVDETGTLSPVDRQALETKLAAIEQRNGSQVVVLMVPTTRPEDIASYANRVANTWKIGRRDVGDGVIVLVAQQDRKMRVEVAKTLEGALPDIAAARIIDGAMKPRFQQNDYAGGLTAAIDQIGARIAGEALPVPAGPGARPTGKGSGFDWTDLAVFLFFGVMVAGPIARRIFGQRLGGLLLGGGAGGLALLVTSSLLIAGGVGVLALLYTWLFSGRGGTVWHGGGGAGAAGAAGGLGGWAGGASSGGWGGGMGGGGGFSSGGGGDFGGGGASGDW